MKRLSGYVSRKDEEGPGHSSRRCWNGCSETFRRKGGGLDNVGRNKESSLADKRISYFKTESKQSSGASTLGENRSGVTGAKDRVPCLNRGRNR